MSRWRWPAAAPTALLLGLVAFALPLRAALPFYERLLDQGNLAFERGDDRQAATDLRLAAFGLLDEPKTLVQALTRLALAQQAQGDTQEATDTVQRVVEVEERFGAYSAADLPQDVRQRFEALLATTLPASALAATPAFAHLAREHEAAQIRALAPAERRQRLEAASAREPKVPLWHRELAELDLAENRPADAVRESEAALAASPGDSDAQCLHGRALAEASPGGGACEAAVKELSACPRSRTEAPYARALLGCLVARGDADAARRLLADLPPAVRGDKALSRLARDVGRKPAASDTAAAPSPAPKKAAKDAPAADEKKTPATAETSLSLAAQADLARAREGLDKAKIAGDLDEPYRLARGVADAYPKDAKAQYLAAEIAYRASRWQQAVELFDRGGDPGADRPELLFYLAVSLYESGQRDRAVEALQRALPHLTRTPFVDSYVHKILASPTKQQG